MSCEIVKSSHDTHHNQCPISCASEIFRVLPPALFQQFSYFSLLIHLSLLFFYMLRCIDYPVCCVKQSFAPPKNWLYRAVKHVRAIVCKHAAAAYGPLLWVRGQWCCCYGSLLSIIRKRLEPQASFDLP